MLYNKHAFTWISLHIIVTVLVVATIGLGFCFRLLLSSGIGRHWLLALARRLCTLQKQTETWIEYTRQERATPQLNTDKTTTNLIDARRSPLAALASVAPTRPPTRKRTTTLPKTNSTHWQNRLSAQPQSRREPCDESLCIDMGDTKQRTKNDEETVQPGV
jgi:hypothetical protein